MRFKLDENPPPELAGDLRSLSHDADSVGDEGLLGATDHVAVDAAHKGVANIRTDSTGGAGVVLIRPDRLGRKSVLASGCD